MVKTGPGCPSCNGLVLVSVLISAAPTVTLNAMHRTYFFRATCAIASLMIDPGDIVSIKGFDAVPAVCATRTLAVGPGLILGAVADGLLEPLDDLPPHWPAALAVLQRPLGEPPSPGPHLRVLP